jgi:hypothetical protein
MIIKQTLTKVQADFIKKHKISDELLIDAQGNNFSEELKAEMYAQQKSIAYNVTGCPENDNHTFHTIEGFCPECHPLKLAVALIENKTGYIYISGSIKGNLIQVGSAVEAKDKIKTINSFSAKYGGYDDWELLFYAKTESLGKAERMTQEKLSDYKAVHVQEKATKLKNGIEIYRCSYNKAKLAMTELLDAAQFEFTQINEKRHFTPEYQFKNLISKSEPRSVPV